ncbi:MAG: hypothetical protein ABJA35_03555 [Parafilimonas sp.]
MKNYYRFAITKELKTHFNIAINYFEKAILHSLSDEKIKEYHSDIERFKRKIEIILNHKEWQEENEEK